MEDAGIHRFSVDVACDVGVNAAIVYYDICFWSIKNDNDGKGFGMYSTIKDFEKRLPYLTNHQIRYSIQRLKDSGYITSKTEYTNRYAVTTDKESILPMVATVANSGNHFANGGKIIQDKEKDNIIIINNKKGARDKLIEEIKTNEIKRTGAMKSLGIYDTAKFLEYADSILCEWELIETDDWSWRHLINHMRKKIDKDGTKGNTTRKSEQERLDEYQSYLFSASASE